MRLLSHRRAQQHSRARNNYAPVHLTSPNHHLVDVDMGGDDDASLTEKLRPQDR
jgi:hypothetical protein